MASSPSNCLRKGVKDYQLPHSFSQSVYTSAISSKNYSSLFYLGLNKYLLEEILFILYIHAMIPIICFHKLKLRIQVVPLK